MFRLNAPTLPETLNKEDNTKIKDKDDEKNEVEHHHIEGLLKIIKNPYALCSPTVNHIVQGFCLTLFYLLQCVGLDFYIFKHFKLKFIIVIFATSDFLCFLVFLYTLITAHKFIRKYTAAKKERDSKLSRRFSLQRLSIRSSNIASDFNKQRNLWKKYNLNKDLKGSVLPFVFISWVTYVGVVSAKITVIFKSSLPDILSLDNVFSGPQTLKMSIGLSSLIFLFLAEGHNWEHLEHPRNRYTKSLCSQTVIDIFDSVSLLSIVMDGPDKEHLLIIENLIIGLANFNLLLPVLRLYKLSMAEAVPTRTDQILYVIHSLSYVIISNGVFLAIRIHIWFYDGEDPSIYLMKNVISIILTMWQLYPAILLLSRKQYVDF